MEPTATEREDLTISIISNSNHCPLYDPCTNPGSSQNKFRSMQGHPAESSEAMSPHVARSDEDWLQEQVNQGLLDQRAAPMRDSQDQGATISTTNTNVGDTDELNEWSNEHMGGHMTKQMYDGEQNEELLMDKTECQNQDTTPTLIPLEANLPTEVPTPMNDDQDPSSKPEHEVRDKSPGTSGDALQDAVLDSTSHQEESQSSDRRTTNPTLHNIA